MALRGMNPSSRSYPSLEQDSNALANAAQLLCRGKGSHVVSDLFSTVLSRTLSRGDPDESAILQSAAHTLCDRQDDDAYSWLLTEIEMECELQYIPDPVSGKHQACVLFSIPIVTPADRMLPTTLHVNDAFESLHQILEEAQVLDSQATFRLLPQLFTAKDLRGRSKTSVRQLTRCLGAQVLAERTPVLELPADFYKESPPSLEDLSHYDYAKLHYLVGVAVADNEFLECLFPELVHPDEETHAETADDGQHKSEAGWLADGSWWAYPFCEKLAECFGWLESEVNCSAPEGYHADLRLGLELLREQDARLQCGLVSADCTQAGVAVVVEEWPLATETGQVVGLAVYLVDAQEPERVYGAISWQAFHHETLDDAVEQLHVMLNTVDLKPADEALSSNPGQVSYLLH